MKELLKTLCNLSGTSGREDKIREFILNEIKDFADCRVDAMGNIIAYKKGKNPANVRVVADAHMDEVGIIATYIEERGFVRFASVGGIETPTLLGEKFIFENGAVGVVCSKPVHLCKEDEKKTLPDAFDLMLDIGAKNREEAEKLVSVGETAVFSPDFREMGDLICSKALDDRAGCAALIKMIKEDAEYDFTATFSVQEEIGLRGAKTVAFSTEPEAAVVIEGTTASDIPGCSGGNKVCEVGGGAVLSFMDRSTMYDKTLYDRGRKLADDMGIPCQTKTMVAGGNNAGAFHLSRGGVRTAAVSLPCRYIHSSSSVASYEDFEAVYNLSKALIQKLAGGEI